MHISKIYNLGKSQAELDFRNRYIPTEKSYVITAWYKQRWEIEIFFKFLKQHLKCKTPGFQNREWDQGDDQYDNDRSYINISVQKDQ